MGTGYLSQNNLPAALDTFQRIVYLRRELVATDPRDTRVRERLMFGYLNLADVLLRMGRAAESIESAREAAELGVALVDAHPDDYVARGYLAEAYARTADALKATDVRKSCAAYQRSLAQYQELKRRTMVASPEERQVSEHVVLEVSACSVGGTPSNR
jgi:hypothetical protein